eukprot:14035404-Alexandrium_andersonii.AAC.1
MCIRDRRPPVKREEPSPKGPLTSLAVRKSLRARARSRSGRALTRGVELTVRFVDWPITSMRVRSLTRGMVKRGPFRATSVLQQE